MVAATGHVPGTAGVCLYTWMLTDAADAKRQACLTAHNGELLVSVLERAQVKLWGLSPEEAAAADCTLSTAAGEPACASLAHLRSTHDITTLRETVLPPQGAFVLLRL